VTRAEAEAIAAAGGQVVVEVLLKLTARIEELERQFGRSARNSSLPPSRDSPEQRKERPRKKGSGRMQGGQPGHPGSASCDGR